MMSNTIGNVFILFLFFSFHLIIGGPISLDGIRCLLYD